ncbi:YncE family protein [Bremerella sp.]|uniref:YncE family protein n=1 Tax=Bremerella sp. TaxID=2795602 RepID=UPI00391D3E81
MIIKRLLSHFLIIFALLTSTVFLHAEEVHTGDTPFMRIIWQDRDTKTLRWGQFSQVGSQIQFKKHDMVEGFPQLDEKRNELVQMERIGRVVVVGIRDDQDGQYQSGWAAIDMGVRSHSHGDHDDHVYKEPPHVLASVVDQSQGNPAHLYQYEGLFYLANDRLNGFTKLDPLHLLRQDDQQQGQFFRGGGGHITLAAIDGKIAYSTWAARDEENNGRIDVSDLSETGEDAVAYSFQLPVGGLHGATTSEGRVFFAPSDGIYYVDADVNLKHSPESIELHHLSLGKDEQSDQPNRTGAFATHRNWVLCNTGKHDAAALCLIDAAAAKPSIIKLPIDTPDGLSLTTPTTVVTAAGKNYAFLFQDRKDGDLAEKLVIVDLDPNADRDLSDAKVVKHLPVGPSQVTGHYGHHEIDFDADRRWAVVTNPGSGKLQLLSLADLEFRGEYEVGGMPTKVLCVGGEQTHH